MSFDPISYLKAKEAKELADNIVDGEVDKGVLRTNIDQKLNDLEVEYAPKLTEVATQLAETASQAKSPLRYGELEMPSNFKPTLPCTFYRDNDGGIKHNMDFNKYKNGIKLYVTLEGNDATGNGTQSRPYRTMTKAIQEAIAGLAPKYEVITNIPSFGRDEFTFNQTVKNKTIAIVSEGSYDESAKIKNGYNTTLAELGAGWNLLGEGIFRTTAEGESFEKVFVGTEVSLHFRKYALGGVFEVSVDGKPSLTRRFSTHSEVAMNVEEIMFSNLEEGSHTVKIKFLGADPDVTYGGTPALAIIATPTITSSYLDYDKAYKYAEDKTVVSANAPYTWVEDGVGTYKTSRSAVRNAVDLLNVDIYKMPIPIKNVSSLAACKATKNSWYADGVSVWVHRLDEQSPDIANTIINIGVSGVNPKLGVGGVVYFENFIFTGWITSSALSVSSETSAPTGELICNQSFFVGQNNLTSLGNGVATEGIKNVYLFDCITAYAQQDGFNYHYATTPLANRRDCFVLEYNCTAYDLGLDVQGAGSNNASSCHEGANILRIGTVGYRTTGAVIIDVNGCYSVLYDCHARTPILNGVKGNGRAFSFTSEGDGIGLGKTYMINCGATEADSSLVIGSTHTATINNFKYDGSITETGDVTWV